MNELEKADLVLVDRELHPVFEDDSGIILAGELHRRQKPVVLMVRSLPHEEGDFDLLRTGAIDGFINRSLDPTEWPPCVASYRPGNRFPNCVAQIRLVLENGASAPPWSAMAESLSKCAARGASDECCVLLRRLIAPCASEVGLRDAAEGQSGAKIFRAEVSFGDGPMKEDLAIKYGTREKIRREAMHYDRYVGPLPDGVAAQLRWRAETEHFGALAYSWVGDSVADGVALGPLSSAPCSVGWRRRQATTDRLFRVSLNSWYQVFRGAEEKPNSTLHDLYTGSGGIFRKATEFGSGEAEPRADLAESYVDTSGTDVWVFALDRRKLPNPVTWAREGPASKIRPKRLAPSHGDLQVRNVYVLPDDSPRLIDFGDTGVHHLFRDFAALEASIRLTCVRDKDPHALIAMEQHANSGGDLDSGLPLDGLGGSGDLREALRTTEIIRRAAREACGYYRQPEESFLEYLYSLVAHMLRYANGRADEFSPAQDVRRGIRIWHAMYAAACATERARALERKLGSASVYGNSRFPHRLKEDSALKPE
jgi:hypothetical protein